MSMKLNDWLAMSAVLAAASVSAGALEPASNAPQRVPAKAAKVVVVSAASSMIAVRDAETGQLRAPTAEEAAALATSAASSDTVAARGTVSGAAAARTLESGAVAYRLGEDTFSFTVVRRAADGSLIESCVTGPAEAKKAMSSPLPKLAKAGAKEHAHE